MGTAKSRTSSGCGCPVRESSKATASWRGKGASVAAGSSTRARPNLCHRLEGRPFQLCYRSSCNYPVSQLWGCQDELTLGLSPSLAINYQAMARY